MGNNFKRMVGQGSTPYPTLIHVTDLGAVQERDLHGKRVKSFCVWFTVPSSHVLINEHINEGKSPYIIFFEDPDDWRYSVHGHVYSDTRKIPDENTFRDVATIPISTYGGALEAQGHLYDNVYPPWSSEAKADQMKSQSDQHPSPR
jgi:hypothetical protein